jgi:hypothetical protein
MGPTVQIHHGLPTPGKAAAPQPRIEMAMCGPRSRAGLMQAMVSGASTMMMKVDPTGGGWIGTSKAYLPADDWVSGNGPCRSTMPS